MYLLNKYRKQIEDSDGNVDFFDMSLILTNDNITEKKYNGRFFNKEGDDYKMYVHILQHDWKLSYNDKYNDLLSDYFLAHDTRYSKETYESITKTKKDMDNVKLDSSGSGINLFSLTALKYANSKKLTELIEQKYGLQKDMIFEGPPYLQIIAFPDVSTIDKNDLDFCFWYVGSEEFFLRILNEKYDDNNDRITVKSIIEQIDLANPPINVYPFIKNKITKYPKNTPDILKNFPHTFRWMTREIMDEMNIFEHYFRKLLPENYREEFMKYWHNTNAKNSYAHEHFRPKGKTYKTRERINGLIATGGSGSIVIPASYTELGYFIRNNYFINKFFYKTHTRIYSK